MIGVITGKRSRWRGLVATGAVLALISGMGVVLVQKPGWIDQLLGLQDPPHMSDNELIAHFYAYRGDFERLRQMIKKDSAVRRITLDRDPPEIPNLDVGPARLAEYHALLEKVGATSISVSGDRKTIELVSTSRGFTTHGSEKGYLHTEGAVDKSLLPELDHFSTNEVGSALRRIEGNWYLYFEGY